MPRVVAVSLGLWLAAGCSSSLELSADLRTDWVPGAEFVGVRVELFGGSSVVSPLSVRDRLATRGTSFLSGRRLADWSDLEPGDYRVRATLLRGDGTVRAERVASLTLRSSTSITLVATRDCAGVVCPGPGDDARLTACLGARCVDPACTPETPDRCGSIACTTDRECASTVACADARCIDTTCFLEARDSLCGAMEWCSPDDGCLPVGLLDGGVRDGGPIVLLDAGLGSDAGAGTDAGPGRDAGGAPPPPPPPCECTTCGAPVPIGGTCRVDCATAPVCQTCTVEVECVESGGTCRFYGEVPGTARYVNEPNGSSCGTTTYGTWSACGGFTSTCDTTGTRSRPVTRRTCTSGACGTSMSTETGSCTRVTDGAMCGSSGQCCLGGVCRTGVC